MQVLVKNRSDGCLRSGIKRGGVLYCSNKCINEFDFES